MENKEPTPVELLKMFADGAKIRLKMWKNLSTTSYAVISKIGKCVDQDGYAFNPTIEKILAGEYELYREPKKLKRYWLWDMKDCGWRRLSEYYDEDGINTDGDLNLAWDYTERHKAEPEQFIDVEVES